MTRFAVLEHPTEHGYVVETVAHHRVLFEHPPNAVAADQSVHSAETEPKLTAAGVKLVTIPAVCKELQKLKALERTRKWKRAYRWRAAPRGISRTFDGTMGGAKVSITSKTG